MGVCDRETGTCACKAGFEGPACERLSCQGGTTSSTDCSGNGRCLSLSELGRFHKNEEGELDPVGYGEFVCVFVMIG
jgi:hypothetical protein